MEKKNEQKMDPNFKFEVSRTAGGENVKLCFACGTCTAVCPVAGIDQEFNPRKIIRQILLGMRAQVLKSPVIWRCIQCYACYATCPQNVKFRDVVKALREMAVREGYVSSATAAEIQNLALPVKVHGELVKALLTDRSAYDDLKKRIEECLGKK